MYISNAGGGSRKFRKGWPEYLPAYIDNIYFTENSLKITENITDKKGKGTAVPSALTLNPPMTDT